MSHASNEHAGLPLSSAIGINFAALLTAVAAAVYLDGALWPCIAFFAVSLLVTTLFVNARGIFLTVVTAPLLFSAAVLAVGYLGARDQLDGGGASSRAAQLLVVYPVVQHFPWLIGLTALATVLGWGRIRLIKRRNREVARAESRQRLAAAASNRKTAAQSRNARQRAVSVDELVRREKASVKKASTSKAPKPRAKSRLSDDLYAD